MIKPIIGIVGKPAMEKDMWYYMQIVDDIRYSLIENGALVIGLLPTERKKDFKLDEELDKDILSSDDKKGLETIIEKIDGVVLEGGLVSNQYEEEIVKICIEKDIPLMGICSGFNNMVRALGGKVHIDDNVFHNQFGSKIAHEVYIEENSRLFNILKTNKMFVNSIHTCMAYEDEIREYKVVARCSTDNNVEAIELEGKKFVMGIKWHPELMKNMNPIFKEFVKECKNYDI